MIVHVFMAPHKYIKIPQATRLQQTINHQSLLFNMGREIKNWFSSLFSWIPQGIKNFLAGGFHFLITLFFSVILIYAIFHLVLHCFPYCCKPVTKTFWSKETWDQQVRPSTLIIEKHVRL